MYYFKAFFRLFFILAPDKIEQPPRREIKEALVISTEDANPNAGTGDKKKQNKSNIK